MSMRRLLFFLLWGFAATAFAQNASVSAPKAATGLNASDGVYDKFVLIRWETAESGGQYRVFRATSASGASLQELTKNWQKSTWFCDYSAEKGRDYYYAVMASDGSQSAPLSRFDKGFVRKETDTAQEDLLSANTPDRYAAGRQLFVLVADVQADSANYRQGAPVALQIALQNIFEESTPRTELRVYLSGDATWDFNDQLLLNKTFSGLPAGATATLNEPITLPSFLLPGAYHLIVVASPEGNILQAKTGVLPINVTRQ
jgi:hypothetical protein